MSFISCQIWVCLTDVKWLSTSQQLHKENSCLGICSPVMFQISLLQNQYASDEFLQACSIGQRKDFCFFVKSCAFIVILARKFERSVSPLNFLHFVTKPLRMPNSCSRNVRNKAQLLLDTEITVKFSCFIVLHYIVYQKSKGCISRIKKPWNMFLDNCPGE